ncbi:MAG: exopolysaccharide biosynthesis polyprenyl glycosylphosphotransferase [Actinomycetota bacterium]|nr:exopolysaccharide biosynthesis polyprenyl glycosylphosphotransferase [Actinomycetota bacterium]
MAVRQRAASARHALAAADVAAAAFALIVGITLLGDHDTMVASTVLALPLVVVVAKISGLYDRDELVFDKSTLDEAPALFQAATLYALLVWLGEGSFVHGHLGRDQVIVLWAILFASSVAFRALARTISRRRCEVERCLLIGAPHAAERLRAKLDGRSAYGATLVGRLPGDSDDPGVGALGTLADLETIVEVAHVQRVVIAPGDNDGEAMLDTIRRAKALGVQVSVLPRLLEVIGSSIEFDQVDGLPVLAVRRFGLTQSSATVKRAFDVAAAAALLVVLAPLLALVAVAIKLTSAGPVLFHQRRVGRDGRLFEIHKFRTMVRDADALKAELTALNEGAEGFFKITSDPRVTAIGRLLRRTSLDELPQLLNVLSGEMSLVGPRPLIEEEDGRIEARHRSRLDLKPGMTGHWQVLGSSRIPLREMVTIDYLYIANWSLWADAKILLRTAAHVVALRGR